jgi:hypothetical protein
VLVRRRKAKPTTPWRQDTSPMHVLDAGALCTSDTLLRHGNGHWHTGCLTKTGSQRAAPLWQARTSRMRNCDETSGFMSSWWPWQVGASCSVCWHGPVPGLVTKKLKSHVMVQSKHGLQRGKLLRTLITACCTTLAGLRGVCVHSPPPPSSPGATLGSAGAVRCSCGVPTRCLSARLVRTGSVSWTSDG